MRLLKNKFYGKKTSFCCQIWWFLIKKLLQKPGHGAQVNRSKPHTLTGAWRTPKPE
jgi:hypothetical protein